MWNYFRYGLLLLLLVSGWACRSVKPDPFVPKPHRYQTGFRFDAKKRSVVRTTGRSRPRSRIAWTVQTRGKGKSLRQQGGARSFSRDAYSARPRRYQGGHRYSSTKKRVIRSGIRKPRSRDSFSAGHRSTHGNYAFNAKRRQVTKARTLFNVFRSRERTSDSFSRRAGGERGSFAYNAKHRRVRQLWNPFRPKHEKESSSFGGRRKTMFKHYVFNKQSKSVKHRKGFFFRLIDRWKNKPYKRKKKDSELELWDPKMRRQMRGGR